MQFLNSTLDFQLVYDFQKEKPHGKSYHTYEVHVGVFFDIQEGK